MLVKARDALRHRLYGQQLASSTLSWTRMMLLGAKHSDYARVKYLYGCIDAAAENPSALRTEDFWARYWKVDFDHQPWVVAHYHRKVGLKVGEHFFLTQDEPARMWRCLDIADRNIPCQLLWDWLDAVDKEKDELHYFCLLSAYSFETLHAELARRVETGKVDAIYPFAAITMAMLFRMTVGGLADDFAKEEHLWKAMYARWDLESRLFLLNVFASLDKKESRYFMYEWGPDLFPEAVGMLDVARATDTHPAKLIRQWYRQQGQPMAEALPIEGLI